MTLVSQIYRPFENKKKTKNWRGAGKPGTVGGALWKGRTHQKEST